MSSTFKPEVGKPCSFFHEGGRGQERWVRGWRYGIISKVEKQRIRVELLVPRWEYNPATRKYTPKPNERVWIPATDVNEAGDTTYHGPRAVEVYKERLEEKKEEQAKADRKVRRLRH